MKKLPSKSKSKKELAQAIDELGAYSHLNDRQREAVLTDAQHLRVIAGAGSGKTRVLVERVIYLVKEKNISPAKIMALTFTNKAANEMKNRLSQNEIDGLENMYLGTFHSICNRFLRRHIKLSGFYEPDYNIITAGEQKTFVNNILKNLNIDKRVEEKKYNETLFSAEYITGRINKLKQDGIRAKDFNITTDKATGDELFLEIYQTYEEDTRKQNLVDFTELLLLTVELLMKYEKLQETMKNYFEAILVDEFQDTDNLQFLFINLIKGKTASLFVVGDEDQAIYSWRGARVENILKLDKQYKNLKTILLEENYRSSKTILLAANSLIKKNRFRLGKKLWTNNELGAKIDLYTTKSWDSEANFIAQEVQKLKAAGKEFRDMTVLYRMNSTSRIVEKALMASQIPYIIHKGIRFFERAEIKNALAYLALSENPHNNFYLQRIINIPRRKIGNAALAKLEELAIKNNLSYWQIINDKYIVHSYFKNYKAAFEDFRNTIQILQEERELIFNNLELKSRRMTEILNMVIDKSGLLDYYKNPDASGFDKDDENRVENLLELVRDGSDFDSLNKDLENDEFIQSYLNYIALATEKNTNDELAKNAVNLMTIHSAKGLEFPVVFIAQFSKGRIPSNRGEPEEERRLAYVALTRAKEKIYITATEHSEYLADIPQEIINHLGNYQSSNKRRFKRYDFAELDDLIIADKFKLPF